MTRMTLITRYRSWERGYIGKVVRVIRSSVLRIAGGEPWEVPSGILSFGFLPSEAVEDCSNPVRVAGREARCFDLESFASNLPRPDALTSRDERGNGLLP